MINFEDIIDFLTQKGVKSLHIEMQSRNELSESQEREIERKPRETKSVKLDRITLTDAEMADLQAKLAAKRERIVETESSDLRATLAASRERIIKTASADDEKLKDRRTAEEKLCDEGIEKATSAGILADFKPVGQVVAPVVEKVTETITVSQSPVVEKTVAAQEPNKDDPVGTAAEKTAGISTATPKNVYETFCDLVSKDNGSVTKEQRLELIAKMGLDDLLRVNNDFQLGLETDKPTEDIRADVAECF